MLTTEVKLVPLALTWILKARVLKLALSPPALACLTTKLVMLKFCPRSTCRNLAPAWEHHLSLLPPETLPLNAFEGPSLALHDTLPVAGLFSATLVITWGSIWTLPALRAAGRAACR